MEPLWTITLFRELTLSRHGSPGDVVHRFRSQKAASLLAFLAYHRGRAFTREYLCELLWPEEDPEIARNRLRVTLASLRRQLEPPGVPFGAVLETIGNGYLRLRAESVQTDTAEFEAAVKRGDATRATELYRGPLLPMLYDEWIPAEQERLQTLFERNGTGVAEPPREKNAPTASPSSAQPTAVPPTASLPAVEMPVYLTRFIGRDTELSHLRALLNDSAVRLITLTGPGGNGKTRLAVEATKTDPTVRAFVPLADLWDASRLGDVLRQSLGLLPTADSTSIAQIAEHLRGQSVPVRLVLDNLEQIALGAAPALADLLSRTPNLSLLITSRRRLDLPGEREVPVHPLDVPTEVFGVGYGVLGGEERDVRRSLEVESSPNTSAAVALFVDRAQSVRPDFQVTARNADDIAALCRLLDGVPLALELAAARVGTLTPEQIRTRLTERTDDFAAGPRLQKEDRHRSLNAVVEWSYSLLPPDLRRFFLALSVFRGGWDLEAAAAVTDERYALDLLSRLRGHSLVTVDGRRFRLLETLRVWAEEHLTPTERDAVAARHADYFLRLGEEAIDHTAGPEESLWLDRVRTEEANLRAAFEYALRIEDADTALRLALILHGYGRARGGPTDTLIVLERAAAQATDATAPYLRARVLVSAGTLAQSVRGPKSARPYLEDALPLARQAENPSLIARCLRSLADNLMLEADYETAQPLYEEALTAQHTLGDERAVIQTMSSMALLALNHHSDFAEARHLMEAGAEYYRRVGDRRFLSYALYNLGEVAHEQGDLAQAERYYRESLNLSIELSDEWHRLYSLVGLAHVAGRSSDPPDVSHRLSLVQDALPLALNLGDPPSLAGALYVRAEIARITDDLRRAVTLLAAAETRWEESGAAPEPGERKRLDTAIAAVRAALPPRSFDAAWKKGSGLSAEEAVSLAMASTPVSVASRSTPTE